MDSGALGQLEAIHQTQVMGRRAGLRHLTRIGIQRQLSCMVWVALPDALMGQRKVESPGTLVFS